MSTLTIKKDRGELDFLALGAVVHRLDPGVIPFRKARSVDIHVSGGEYNVAANLSDCFGLRTGIATAMVNYGIGELVQTRVRETGVRPFYKWFEHDGVRGPNIATVYSDRGHGVRPPVVFYNRANEAGALLKPGDFDWAKIFAAGVRWFHSGGIFAALSETTSELIAEAMHAARAAGASLRFDLNYRAKLWAAGGGLDRAHKVLPPHCRPGRRAHRQRGGPAKKPRHSGPDLGRSTLDPDTFFLMIDRVVEQFSEHQAGGDHVARGPLDQSPRLGGGAVAGRPAVRQPDLPSRRQRPHRRRRRLRLRLDLRPAGRTVAGGIAPPRLGPRRF